MGGVWRWRVGRGSGTVGWLVGWWGEGMGWRRIGWVRNDGLVVDVDFLNVEFFGLLNIGFKATFTNHHIVLSSNLLY